MTEGITVASCIKVRGATKVTVIFVCPHFCEFRTLWKMMIASQIGVICFVIIFPFLNNLSFSSTQPFLKGQISSAPSSLSNHFLLARPCSSDTSLLKCLNGWFLLSTSISKLQRSFFDWFVWLSHPNLGLELAVTAEAKRSIFLFTGVVVDVVRGCPFKSVCY